MVEADMLVNQKVDNPFPTSNTQISDHVYFWII